MDCNKLKLTCGACTAKHKNLRKVGEEVGNVGVSLQKSVNPTNVKDIKRCLLWGGKKWNFGGIKGHNGTINFSINGAVKLYNQEDLYQEDPLYKPMVETILERLGKLVPYTFSYVENFNESILDFNFCTGKFFWSPYIAGYANPPGYAESWIYGDPSSKDDPDSDGCIFLNTTYFYDGFENMGSWAHILTLHELGHALGLAHPHDKGGVSTVMPGVKSSSQAGTYGQNDFIYTVMSYRDTSSKYGPNSIAAKKGFVDNFMGIDTACLQWLYGKSKNSDVYDTYEITGETGNNWKVIYDHHTVNTLSSLNSVTPIKMDIRKANLKLKSPHAGGFISTAKVDLGKRGGFLIAHNTDIKIVKMANVNDTVYTKKSSIIKAGNGTNTVHVRGRNVHIDGKEQSSSKTYVHFGFKKMRSVKISVDDINKVIIVKKRNRLIAKCKNVDSIKFKTNTIPVARLYRIRRRRRRRRQRRQRIRQRRQRQRQRQRQRRQRQRQRQR